METKLHNPKSYMPAVYIPAWLLQVNSNELSLSAKVLYGRLAQWSTTHSTVHRSTNQLAKEMGVSQRVVKRFLEELRDVGLIETYQATAGGHNCYRFLDHEWIHAPLLNVFNYGNDDVPRDENVTTPVTKTSLPRDENVTPKIKEIKENKKEIKSLWSSDDDRIKFESFWNVYPKKAAKKDAIKAWTKNKLHEKADLIITDVVKRTQSDWAYRDKNHIPHPATYLNGERWNDEIITHTGVKSHVTETIGEKSSRLLRESYERDVAAEQLNRDNQHRAKTHANELDYNPISPISRNMG